MSAGWIRMDKKCEGGPKVFRNVSNKLCRENDTNTATSTMYKRFFNNVYYVLSSEYFSIKTLATPKIVQYWIHLICLFSYLLLDISATEICAASCSTEQTAP